MQKENEPLDVFITDLRKLSKSCNFGDLRDSLIRDRIVCGIADTKVRDRLLREHSVSLDRCIDICRAAEIAELQSKQLTDEANSIHAIREKAKKWKPKQKADSGQKSESRENEAENKQGKCKYCGLIHGKKCPAYGRICRNCKKYNHFEKMCRFKKMNMVEEVEEEDTDLFVGSILNQTKGVNTIKEWVQKLEIRDKEIKCKVDTGAEVNILNMKTAKKIKAEIRSSKVKLKGYDGSTIDVTGMTTIPCKIKNVTHDIDFQIVDIDAPCIIGLPGIEEFKLLRKVDIVGKNNLQSLLMKYD